MVSRSNLRWSSVAVRKAACFTLFLAFWAGTYRAAVHDVDLATLAGPVGFTIRGAPGGSQFGYAVSSAGDVNGDGVDDVIVGARMADFWGTGTGTTYVLFGRTVANGVAASYTDIYVSTLAATGSSAGFAIFGGLGQMSGHSVSAAGDINKDGIGDIIVGAMLADPAGYANVGVSYVIFGRAAAGGATSYANILAGNLVAAGSTLGFAILGGPLDGLSGQSVSSGGDVNGDGVDDVIVGSPDADPTGGTARVNAGASYVVFGRRSTLGAASYANVALSSLLATGSTTGFAIIGGSSGDQSGYSVAGAGDVNGDGIKDILLGAPYANVVIGGVTRTSAGISYVIFGRRNTTGTASYANIDLLQLRDAGSPLGFAIWGASAFDMSGFAVSTAGDVNGDGRADILVGGGNGTRLQSSSAGPSAGAAYVIFGRSYLSGAGAYGNIDLKSFAATGLTSGFSIWGAHAGDYTGWSLGSAGDVNGDGLSDIIIGAHRANVVRSTGTAGAAGIAYVVFGRKYTSGVYSYSSVNLATFAAGSSLGFRILGVATEDLSATSDRRAGDINKDGVDDMIVGACLAAAPTIQSGAAYVIFGAPASPTSQPSSQPSRQPSTQPTNQPLSCPSSQPSAQPTRQPTSQPTSRPSVQPSRQPSTQPTSRPSRSPSSRPTAQPSSIPSAQPSSGPSRDPSAQPSSRPSAQPTRQPISQPSCKPSGQPSQQPSGLPSSQPTAQPSVQPSSHPSAQPLSGPSSQPSSRPSHQPSSPPTTQPSGLPSEQPSAQPSAQPQSWPTSQPSGQPTTEPSQQPLAHPSSQPSTQPSGKPSTKPSSGPSARPTAQPSVLPTSKPSAQPSSMPSGMPSTQPSGQPSQQPTAHPSTWPTSKPSSRPSTQPSSTPSTQPTARPTTQPTRAPSAQPSSLPSIHPSSQPSGYPTTVPSTQPSTVPSSQPSQQPFPVPTGQPTGVPSVQPTRAPTGEWVTIVNQTALTRVFAVSDQVWTCADRSAECIIADAMSGNILTRYSFDWESVTHVFGTGIPDVVAVCGASISGSGVRNSEVAICIIQTDALRCTANSYYDAAFLAAAYVPYPRKFVYIGKYNAFASISIVDVLKSGVQSYMYTASNMKALTLSQVRSPLYFVGGFIAGTAIRATASPVNYIVAGMVRTEAGILSGMALMPQDDDIENSADLVTAMELESTGPDSFIAGALQLSGVAGKHAYLLRVNALFMSIQYCMQYKAISSRRALSEGAALSSVVRGVVLVDAMLYMIVDRVEHNVTSLTMLQVSATSGAIVKQVHISAPNATSLRCTSMSSVNSYLCIVCTIHRPTNNTHSVLLTVNQALAFAELPPGFVRSEETIFETERVPFKRTVLTITKTPTVLATTSYEFSTADSGSSRQPTVAPSAVPSMPPSTRPTAQPSSCPSAVPSVSPQPTSQPSSASPTITHRPSLKPTAEPTQVPTTAPSLSPSLRPSARPTVGPTEQPSAAPTHKPTSTPTAYPTRRPSLRATAAPSNHPSPVPSVAPSQAAVVPVETPDADGGSGQPRYVVGAAVGGGLGLLLVCYVYYQYRHHQQEEKAKDLRRKDYYIAQALLVAEAHAEMERYLQHEAELAAERREQKRAQEASKEAKAKRAVANSGGRYGYGTGTFTGAYGAGAYAVGPMFDASTPRALSATSSATLVVSSLHSSEITNSEYTGSNGGGALSMDDSGQSWTNEDSTHDTQSENEEDESNEPSLNDEDSVHSSSTGSVVIEVNTPSGSSVVHGQGSDASSVYDDIL